MCGPIGQQHGLFEIRRSLTAHEGGRSQHVQDFTAGFPEGDQLADMFTDRVLEGR